MDIFSTPSPNSYFYTHYLMRGGGGFKICILEGGQHKLWYIVCLALGLLS